MAARCSESLEDNRTDESTEVVSDDQENQSLVNSEPSVDLSGSNSEDHQRTRGNMRQRGADRAEGAQREGKLRCQEDNCDKSYHVKSALRRHVREAHGPPPRFICEVCKASFKRRYQSQPSEHKCEFRSWSSRRRYNSPRCLDPGETQRSTRPSSD